MKNRSSHLAESPQQLLDDLRHLVSEAEQLISGAVTEQAGEKMEALRTRFAQAQERFGELYADTRRRVVAGAQTTDAAIRAHPYESLAIAVGLGVVLGMLLRRSD
ncbi:MAG TPA: hypothetical protein VGD81_11520 [Opitutaceae bacterium]